MKKCLWRARQGCNIAANTTLQFGYVSRFAANRLCETRQILANQNGPMQRANADTGPTQAVGVPMSNAEINSIRRGGQLPQGERPARKSQARHTAFIQQLAMLYPGLQTRGFGKAMAELYEQQDGAFGGTIYSTFKPDAWRVCRDTATIEIHEVVVTHYPSRAALLGMGRFWFAWDAIWEDDDSLMPRAFIHHEGVATPTEIDLQYWYYEGLRDYSGRDRVSALNSEIAYEIEASRLRGLA